MANGRNLTKIVSQIIKNVNIRGDNALFEYEKKFNGISLDRKSAKISQIEFLRAYKKLPGEKRKRLREISNRIFYFHRKIKNFFRDVVVRRGSLRIRHRFVPIEKVAVYIPGGKFSYPSSVFMNAIPAKVAGVKTVFAASARPTDEVLAACYLSGVDALFRISGAQAIAAFAFGTKTVPEVNFIAGPGNKFVVEAKRQVFGRVGIDLLAGPSEILVIADDSANRDYLLADFAAQLEHASDAKAYLITSSASLASFIGRKLKKVKIFKVSQTAQQIKKANNIAAEHTFVFVRNFSSFSGKITKSGAVFLGDYSPVVMGDYVAGPSHTLPTGRTALFSSGLNVGTFLRSFAEIAYDKKSFEEDAPLASSLAEIEGMKNHKNSIEVRRRQK